jgi:hypothetical protein
VIKLVEQRWIRGALQIGISELKMTTRYFMSRYRIATNASSRLSEPHVTHSPNRSGPEGVLVCGACGKLFRLKRPWQKHCSRRCRQRAYVRAHPMATPYYYGA